MRAWEFMSEGVKHTEPITKNNKHPRKDQEAVMTGAYRMAGTNDKLIELGRIMRAVAASDGVNVPKVEDNWVGLNDTAHPYTKQEADMLKKAFKAVGIEWQDALNPNPDNKSVEPDGTNTTSPVVAFDGYIKKKSKKKKKIKESIQIQEISKGSMKRGQSVGSMPKISSNFKPVHSSSDDTVKQQPSQQQQPQTVQQRAPQSNPQPTSHPVQQQSSSSSSNKVGKSIEQKQKEKYNWLGGLRGEINSYGHPEELIAAAQKLKDSNVSIQDAKKQFLNDGWKEHTIDGVFGHIDYARNVEKKNEQERIANQQKQAQAQSQRQQQQQPQTVQQRVPQSNPQSTVQAQQATNNSQQVRQNSVQSNQSNTLNSNIMAKIDQLKHEMVDGERSFNFIVKVIYGQEKFKDLETKSWTGTPKYSEIEKMNIVYQRARDAYQSLLNIANKVNQFNDNAINNNINSSLLQHFREEIESFNDYVAHSKWVLDTTLSNWNQVLSKYYDDLDAERQAQKDFNRRMDNYNRSRNY